MPTTTIGRATRRPATLVEFLWAALAVVMSVGVVYEVAMIAAGRVIPIGTFTGVWFSVMVAAVALAMVEGNRAAGTYVLVGAIAGNTIAQFAAGHDYSKTTLIGATIVTGAAMVWIAGVYRGRLTAVVRR